MQITSALGPFFLLDSLQVLINALIGNWLFQAGPHFENTTYQDVAYLAVRTRIRTIQKAKKPIELIGAVQPAALIAHLHEPRPDFI